MTALYCFIEIIIILTVTTTTAVNRINLLYPTQFGLH